MADIPLDLMAKPKLKVFKGTSQIAEQGLPGIPSAIQTIYIDEQEPRVPGGQVQSNTFESFNNFHLLARSSCGCRGAVRAVL